MKNRTQNSLNLRLCLAVICAVPILSACQSQHRLVLHTVGPPSAVTSLDLGGVGFLRVFTATQTKETGKNINYYPHTPYVISTNGHEFRWVQNSVAYTDENPELVSLPAGFYTVEAKDDDYGLISVPVVVKDGETTTVYLEHRKLPFDAQVNTRNAVRLPNGRMVGCAARLPAQ